MFYICDLARPGYQPGPKNQAFRLPVLLTWNMQHTVEYTVQVREVIEKLNFLCSRTSLKLLKRCIRLTTFLT